VSPPIQCAKELKKKKVGGVLRHTMKNLKKVARLPGKDRREVLNILNKEVRKRRGKRRSVKSGEVVCQGSAEVDSSLASVNKDWEHWVVMHGDEKAVEEDVQGVGKAIGVKFDGGTGNMFGVLSRGVSGKQKLGDSVVGAGGGSVVGGGWCAGGVGDA
jgi:hypothetical protein